MNDETRFPDANDPWYMTREDLIDEVEHLRFVRGLAYGLFGTQIVVLLAWWGWSAWPLVG